MIKVGKDRVIAFDKTLRYKRQADYKISDYEMVPFKFDTGMKKVYKNFNLSIFVDDACNADCKFCVAQLRYEHRGKLYNKHHIVDNKEYMERLREVLTYVQPLNPSISITGGEPTISNRLVPIIKLVDELGYRKRTITTNGSGLFRMIDGKTIPEHLIDCKSDHLNISRAYVDEEKNKQIMLYQEGTEYSSNDRIREVAQLVKESPMKIRMSCILLKEGVNSVKKIKEYIDFYQEYGIDNFIFRQLMDYDHLAVNKEKVAYCDKNKVELNDIWEEMESHLEFIPYMNLLGYYYYVELYDYHGCRIASESANLEQQYKEKENNQDTVYEMVFHTDGILSGSWVPNEEILMNYTEKNV